jgi:hypothetical protein
MQPEEFEMSVSRLAPNGPSEPDCAEPASESRALVSLSSTTGHSERVTSYYHGPFSAQLVATKDLHPQTRERRRAEPVVALAAYRATAALGTD